MLVKPTFVESSTIECMAYDLGKMFVRFHSGASYSYDGVGEELYRTLLTAESIGSAFHRLVKQARHIRFKKLDSDPFI